MKRVLKGKEELNMKQKVQISVKDMIQRFENSDYSPEKKEEKPMGRVQIMARKIEEDIGKRNTERSEKDEHRTRNMRKIVLISQEIRKTC